MAYRAGAGSGMFNSYAFPDTRPRIDIGSGIDALVNGASSLIHAAYFRKRQDMLDQQARDRIAYQHQRDQLGDARYNQARQDRLVQQDRQAQLEQARIDAANARAGYVPPTTAFDTTPSSIDFSHEFSTDTSFAPSQSTGAAGSGDQFTPIQRALMRAAPPSPVAPEASSVHQRLTTIPGHFDPSATPAAIRAQQTIRARASAYEGAGLSSEDAAAAAVNPSLATKLLAPHGKKVYFGADGSPVVVDAQAPEFPPGFKKPIPASRANSSRDSNVSAAIATQRAIANTNREQTAALKSVRAPAAFSTNPQADSAAVVGANTPVLERAGDLAVRGDSLRRAYDQQASAIGTGRTARAAIDVSRQRQELDRRRQQMEAIIANPRAPVAVKARAQALFREYVESIGGRP